MPFGIENYHEIADRTGWVLAWPFVARSEKSEKPLRSPSPSRPIDTVRDLKKETAVIGRSFQLQSATSAFEQRSGIRWPRDRSKLLGDGGPFWSIFYHQPASATVFASSVVPSVPTAGL